MIRKFNSANNILSPKDILLLREAYNNYIISDEYIISDVLSLMNNENLDKETALNTILNFIRLYI